MNQESSSKECRDMNEQASLDESYAAHIRGALSALVSIMNVAAKDGLESYVNFERSHRSSDRIDTWRATVDIRRVTNL